MTNRYSPCRACIDYLPSHLDVEKGLCDRVGDPNFLFYAYTNSTFKCHFDNGPRQSISEQEILERQQEVQERHKSFEKSLEQATKIVESWPEWKQKMIRESIMPSYAPNLINDNSD